MLKNLSKRGTLATLLISLISVASVLATCGGKPSIQGKWEQVSGESTLPFFGGTGTLWEFFGDGTVSMSVMGNISGKYSWPDNSHLKIEFAQGSGVVYEFTQSSDEITLKDPSTENLITLKRYQELSPNPQALAGMWEKGAPDDSQCFLDLGLDSAPQQINFELDGTFSVQQEADTLGTGISLSGQFSVSGNSLHVSATGTKIDTGILGFGASQEQIGGELNCQVTVSHSRLLFKDEQGQVTLYVRAQK